MNYLLVEKAEWRDGWVEIRGMIFPPDKPIGSGNTRCKHSWKVISEAGDLSCSRCGRLAVLHGHGCHTFDILPDMQFGVLLDLFVVSSGMVRGKAIINSVSLEDGRWKAEFQIVGGILEVPEDSE